MAKWYHRKFLNLSMMTIEKIISKYLQKLIPQCHHQKMHVSLQHYLHKFLKVHCHPLISLYGEEQEQVPSPFPPTEPKSESEPTSEQTPDNNSGSESSDNEVFPVDISSDDDIEDGNDYFGMPLQWPPSIPVVNFPDDVDH